ncbi:MAG TPA: hypothetical protein VMH05_19180 [Bryobacteraceae bacterium]|nr:hypothetical protein [Bryobacteraceae bacterium]
MLEMRSRLFHNRAALICLAIAALCIVVIRACLQSITVDEADSFLQYARNPQPSHWWPVSDNHVLNSLLMRLAAAIFGVSNLTVRLPAILGALLYIGSAFYLCLLITDRRLLQWLLFSCLVFNPMLLDYLVAARGYSLAIGFFLAALAVIASAMMNNGGGANLSRKSAWISVLLALSCSANLSFAIANAVTLTIFFLWTVRRHGFGRAGYLRLAAATYLPGLLIGFILCGSMVLNWPKGELYFGSKHMSEMFDGFAKGSFDDLNPNLINPMLLHVLHPIKSAGPWIVALAALFLFANMEVSRFKNPGPQAESLGNFVRLVALISAATLLFHWLAFKIVHIPLPKDRTGLFFLPLWTLALVGSLAYLTRLGIVGIPRRCAIVVLAITAFYFVGCLRLGYFKEWKFDSDTKTLYWIMADLHQRCGIEKFGIDWRYHLPLNFYRENYGTDSLKEFSGSTSGELPPDRDAYAIFFPTSQEFISHQKLQLLYHNDESDAAVAIRGCPAVVPSPP